MATKLNRGRYRLFLNAARRGEKLHLAVDIHFDPNKHPRGTHGHFTKVLQSLKVGDTAKLPDGRSVKRISKDAHDVQYQHYSHGQPFGQSRDARQAAEQLLGVEHPAPGPKSTKKLEQHGAYSIHETDQSGVLHVHHKDRGLVGGAPNQAEAHSLIRDMGGRIHKDSSPKPNKPKQGGATSDHHFAHDTDSATVRQHLENMKVGESFTIEDIPGEGDGTPWHVKRYSADDWQYTPGDGRRRIGSMDEVLQELFPMEEHTALDKYQEQDLNNAIKQEHTEASSPQDLQNRLSALADEFGVATSEILSRHKKLTSGG